MRKIGLIGYGHLGQQIEHLISGLPDDFYFIYFDDIAFKNNVRNSFPFKDFLRVDFKDFEFQIGLGYKHLRKKREIIDILIRRGRKLFTFIHPSAVIDKTAKIDVGTVIFPNVTIDKDVIIRKGCLLHLCVTISHNSIIEDCCYLSPSVTISGFVEIGKMVFIGTNSCVANNITIGDFAVIGIGSVITKHVELNQFVIGNPQRAVKQIRLS